MYVCIPNHKINATTRFIVVTLCIEKLVIRDCSFHAYSVTTMSAIHN